MIKFIQRDTPIYIADIIKLKLKYTYCNFRGVKNSIDNRPYFISTTPFTGRTLLKIKRLFSFNTMAEYDENINNWINYRDI